MCDLTWEHTKTTLKQGDIVLPQPYTIEGWEDDLKKWPKITYGCIFSYVNTYSAVDGEAMKNLKSSEAYQYLHSNKVGCVLTKSVEDFVFLKADVEPSQSLHNSHQAWAVVSNSGEVQTAGCSYVAGPGRSCSHATAILWKVSS